MPVRHDVYTGYDITAPENRFLTEIFKGTNRTAAPRKVLLYRPTASGAVKATMEIAPLTATAKYVGVRGNDISVVVTALSSPEGSFEVSTVVDGEIKDQQTAKTVEELAANSWVDWSGTGALTANVGTALTGGEDGVVAASAYSAFLTAIEPYKFDVLIYDGADNTARTAMEASSSGSIPRRAAILSWWNPAAPILTPAISSTWTPALCWTMAQP